MGYYNFAVIQEMPEGVCIGRTPEVWYEVTYEDEPIRIDTAPKVRRVEYDPLNKGRKGYKTFLGW